ncbi:MAG: RluA family pseudouridine synthase [Clostridia bacterium]|nr:RluA family pseudouridine synthase [Clostridia bacterium]
MDILYQDNRILVCIKPAGILSTDEPGGLPELIRKQLGDPHACVRTVHRLDRVVGGVMILARSREAAKRLSAQIQQHKLKKVYLAVVHGNPGNGIFQDLLLRSKEERKTYVVTELQKGAQEAILNYQTLFQKDNLSLVKIQLKTGRTHQIRAQFSSHGFPLFGDKKYGAPEESSRTIALWSHSLSFTHPQTEEPVFFSALPPQTVPWTDFSPLWQMDFHTGGSI